MSYIGNATRGGRGRGRGRDRGTGRPNQGKEICFWFQRGNCKYGNQCKRLHRPSAGGDSEPQPWSSKRASRADETPEQQQARQRYSSWKSILKEDVPYYDNRTVHHVWHDALAILDGDDRDKKQDVPRDLDDGQNGRQHIKNLLEKRARSDEHNHFLDNCRLFLLVFTHPIFLDCLSVDTYVGALYNFISGANGNRAIPFFQHVCEVIVAVATASSYSIPLETMESTLATMTLALRELLRREQRARFNEDISSLLESVKNSVEIITTESQSTTRHIVLNLVAEIRAIIARAHGLLTEEPSSEAKGTATSVTRSTYPRDFPIPRNRHDNDKADITQMSIFPTLEEIMSDAQEFLPSTDRDQPHFLESPLERHIDTHFRLFRHDIFGKFKDALASVLQAASEDASTLSNGRLSLGDMRAYDYSNAFISHVTFTTRRRLEMQMSFLQPHQVRKKSQAEKRRWWEESKRLDEGALLSFIWIHGSVVKHLFMTVTAKTNAMKEPGLTNQSKIATITTRLTAQDRSAVELVMQASCRNVQGVLIEFPSVLPATFVPVLENLQNMHLNSRLPFRQWILPDLLEQPANGKAYLDIPPPLYARSPRFAFSLEPIIKANKATFSIRPDASADDKALVDELEDKTELDRGQCRALVHALTREFAFIQGPPGTGKSYLGVKLMRILLTINPKVNLGPVVVVCYTNHALDQFLEHLIDIGISRVIRIGPQSRSAKLEAHNLRIVAQSETKTRSENWQAHLDYNALEECEKDAEMYLGRLHGVQRNQTWQKFDYHLRERYSNIHRQFQQVDGEGWKTAGRHPFDIWRAGVASNNGVPSTLTPNQLIKKATASVHTLSPQERDALVEFWVDEMQRKLLNQLYETVEKAEKHQRHLTSLHEEVDRRILQSAQVIGITTTGLAKRMSTLKHIRCKVVICEEAGEVLEPHMISALLPTVEHFIQIGDHEQLRPTISNYDLSVESKKGQLYQLDRSQFERLSVGEAGRPRVPVAQLNVQRRMRPDISTLIRETIYDKLVDHPTTNMLPHVIGMRENVFWLDHDNLEEDRGSDMHNKSRTNIWEVEMVHALVRHVVRQGVYKSSDIAVLTPYTGQLQKLRAAMRSDFEIVLSDRDEEALAKDGLAEDPGDEMVSDQHRKTPLEKKKLSELLRIATVDNFQGEEAKIVIISLVRSNKEKKVGFLRTTNRINVLLSRAQHGMYLIGNAETYANVPMWQKVTNMLGAKGVVGQALDLCCPRHKDVPIQIEQPDDFAKFSPEGGCREACIDRLPDCGHQCQARCHSEAMHNVWRCEKPCQRCHKPCNHACQKRTCGEDCGNCMVNVNNVKLPCSHTKDGVLCYKTLDLPSIQCEVLVSKKAPCGHIVEVNCWKDVDSELFRCPTPCDALLACGHVCKSTCGRCNTKDKDGQAIVNHPACKIVCKRKFGTCHHTCSRKCHKGDCGLCQASCEVRCKHSQCKLKCHEPCAPCVERCTWSCEHVGACSMPCGAPCNRLPCDERCPKLLACGHQCPSLCGEECPSEYCHACGMRHDAAQVDLIMMQDYGAINVDDSPIVVLGCGHFFTAESLDGHVGMREVYEMDEKSGDYSGLKDVSSTFAEKTPQCPHCRHPIRQYTTQRFNRLINRAVIDEMSKRFLVTGQTRLRELEREAKAARISLEKSLLLLKPPSMLDRPSIKERAASSVSKKFESRYDGVVKLETATLLFERTMADSHQPMHKLHDATVHAMRNNASLDAALATISLRDTTPTADRDRRIMLGIQMIKIKIQGLMIEDKFGVLKLIQSQYPNAAMSIKFANGAPADLTKPFLEACGKLIAQCKKTNLPKIAVETSLHYAHIARRFETSGLSEGNEASVYREEAQKLLGVAQELCKKPFQNADVLLEAVNESIKLLRREWYEEVSPEELEVIKKAMVGGPRGIATHSGHWYQCVNGHPFAIGECGMPMELASCPECAAPIGGQGHRAVQGVTRATEMEH